MVDPTKKKEELDLFFITIFLNFYLIELTIYKRFI